MVTKVQFLPVPCKYFAKNVASAHLRKKTINCFLTLTTSHFFLYICHIINFLMKNTMEINYYRESNAQGTNESWQNCQFTSETNLSDFTIRTLVSINGQPILRTHHTTYLTGRETCHAHHFAKHLAIKVLNDTPITQSTSSDNVHVGSGSAAVSSESSASSSSSPCKVLWIDTLHGPHISTRIYHELTAHANDKESLYFICLDILGGQRDNHYMLSRNIEALIKELNPTLVVIDDIDHLMPFCGINIANEFCRIIRDVVNHTDTAFLFIGYNHLGKKASTTGNLGKYLFLDSSDIFSLTTQRDLTTVRLINSYDMSHQSDDTIYSFIIGNDNLPHEAERHPKTNPIDYNPASPNDNVNKAIVTVPSSDNVNEGIVTPPSSNNVHVVSGVGVSSPSSPSSPSSESSESSETTPSSTSVSFPKGCGSSTSYPVNNSLTLPLHPLESQNHASSVPPKIPLCRESVTALK